LAVINAKMNVLFLACLVALVAVPAVHSQACEAENCDTCVDGFPTLCKSEGGCADGFEYDWSEGACACVGGNCETFQEEEEDEDEEPEAIQFSFGDDDDIIDWEPEIAVETEDQAPEPEVKVNTECHLLMHKRIHAEGAECQEQVDDLDACKALCEELEECTAMDYNYDDTPWQGCRCWIHYDDVPEFLLNDNTNVDHYVKSNC